ncbi:MAG: ABC transporter ATP-binding protein [Hyphomicrobiaceae bacterium]
MISLTLGFLRDLWCRLGWKLGGLLAWLVLSAVFGALSTAAMLPLLEAAGISGGRAGGAGQFIAAAVRAVQQGAHLPDGTIGYAAVVGALLAASYVFYWLHAATSARLQAEYVAGWQSDLFRTILAARWGFLRKQRLGDLTSTLDGEIVRLNGAFYQASALAAALVHIGVYVAAALLVSWPVTIAILLTGAALIATSLPWMRRGARMGYTITAQSAELQATAVQFLGLGKLVKATATERGADSLFSRLAHRVQQLNARVTTDGATVRALFELASALLVIGILIGGPRIGVGAAEIIVVMGLFVRLFPRLSSLQQSTQALATVIAGLSSVQRLHAAALAEQENAGEGPLPFAATKPVAVSLASLTVVADGRTILDSVDLEIRSGELVAIVGPSGAGKSTLVDCLLGLVAPTRGEVWIDGHALGELPLATWRRSVGYVAQDAAILDATVAENLAWGHANASRADLERAVAQAAAGGVIAGMPDGYDTLLGPKGRSLSGGERQRIGLARALVGGRSLLILDEATSAQDVETELGIIEAIRGFKGAMTMVMIAHRLTSVRFADRICVLEQGRLVEVGTFEALRASDSRFAALWRAQGTVAGATRIADTN